MIWGQDYPIDTQVPGSIRKQGQDYSIDTQVLVNVSAAANHTPMNAPPWPLNNLPRALA